MKAHELIDLIQKNLPADADVNFLVLTRDNFFWSGPPKVVMSADVDDPALKGQGALVFEHPSIKQQKENITISMEPPKIERIGG